MPAVAAFNGEAPITLGDPVKVRTNLEGQLAVNVMQVPPRSLVVSPERLVLEVDPTGVLMDKAAQDAWRAALLREWEDTIDPILTRTLTLIEWEDTIRFTTDPIRKAEKLNGIIRKDPAFAPRMELAEAMEELHYFRSNRSDAEAEMQQKQKVLEQTLKETDAEYKKVKKELAKAHEDNKELRVKVIEATDQAQELYDDLNDEKRRFDVDPHADSSPESSP